MRKVVVLIVLMFVSGTVVAQPSPQVKFDGANDLLESGDYRNALKSYREIESSETVSGALYLNMGIAAVQLDSLGLAKFYFLNAQKFDGTTESASQALEFVNSQFSRQSAKLPKLPWDKAVDSLKINPGTFGLFLIGYVLLCITLLLIITLWFNLISIPKAKNVIATCITVSVIIIALAYYVDYVDQRYDEALLIKAESTVSTAPGEDKELVSMAYEGYDIIIDWKKSADQENWYYIRLGNGQYGWIKAEGIKIL